MLISVDSKRFKMLFPFDPHPFISDPFLNLNRHKVEKIFRLVEDSAKVSVGFTAGLKDGVLMSPFSAPFGGFHFRHEHQYSTDIDNFLEQLKTYACQNNISRIEITLPPDIYNLNANTKTTNSLLRNQFIFHLPDITHWIDLKNFNGEYTIGTRRTAYREALRNQLRFEKVNEISAQQEVYDVIRNNRMSNGRPIYMNFEDLLSTAKIWTVDFFRVVDRDENILAGSVFYRAHPTICFLVFWGDNDSGRCVKVMNFFLLNLFNHYKHLGYHYLDTGISTESGIPNNGLLNFKETHEGISSLRYSFEWNQS